MNMTNVEIHQQPQVLISMIKDQLEVLSPKIPAAVSGKFDISELAFDFSAIGMRGLYFCQSSISNFSATAIKSNQHIGNSLSVVLNNFDPDIIRSYRRTMISIENMRFDIDHDIVCLSFSKDTRVMPYECSCLVCRAHPRRTVLQLPI